MQATSASAHCVPEKWLLELDFRACFALVGACYAMLRPMLTSSMPLSGGQGPGLCEQVISASCLCHAPTFAACDPGSNSAHACSSAKPPAGANGKPGQQQPRPSVVGSAQPQPQTRGAAPVSLPSDAQFVLAMQMGMAETQISKMLRDAENDGGGDLEVVAMLPFWWREC